MRVCACRLHLPSLSARRRLRELRAVNCGRLSLAASELHCPALQVLNLFGCRQVDAEGARAWCRPAVICYGFARMQSDGSRGMCRVP